MDPAMEHTRFNESGFLVCIAWASSVMEALLRRSNHCKMNGRAPLLRSHSSGKSSGKIAFILGAREAIQRPHFHEYNEIANIARR